MAEKPAPTVAEAQATRLAFLEKQLLELPQSAKWWKRNDWASLYKAAEDAADSYVDQLLKDFNPEESVGSEGKTKASCAVETIDARRNKLPLSSGTTDQIIGICQQILAFGAAGLALCIGFGEKLRTLGVVQQKLTVLAGIFYSELVVLSLFVLVYYFLQSHFRYPFLYFSKIGNAWPYFYYASISHNISRSPIQLASTRARDGVQYAIDFACFAKNLLNENATLRLRAELQQYFLLVAYQGYVNQFDLRLSNLFVCGFIGASAATAALAAVSLVK
jgi:hypothetical protein